MYGTQQCCCADSSVVEGSGVLGCVAVLQGYWILMFQWTVVCWKHRETADLVTVHRTLEVFGPEPYC